VDREFEPQLVLLMNDDEEKLVIGVGALPLRRKNLLELEIPGVVGTTARARSRVSGHDKPAH